MGADPLRLRGQVVDGKYDVSDFVEHRGSRVVYRGIHRVWGEPVALVFLVPGTAEAAIRGFLRAGAIMARLSSRSSAFVQTRDAGIVRSAGGDLAYCVAEWVEGRSLADVLSEARRQADSRLGLAALVEWFGGVLDALASAHAEGIVHGRIEPSNILVVGGTFMPRGVLKLRGLTEAAWRAAVPGGMGDTPAPNPIYAAPETAAGEVTLLGPWTDVYGLASVLIEVIYGRPLPPGGAAQVLPQCGLHPDEEFSLARAVADSVETRCKSIDIWRGGMREAAEVAAVLEPGRVPRRTMVVSEQVAELAGQADSAGAFEVPTGEIQPGAPLEREADAPRARVRLAHTQRIDASHHAITAPEVAQPARPRRTGTPLPPRPSGSGVYDRGGLSLTQEGGRFWPLILIGIAVLGMMGLAVTILSWK